MLYKVNIEYEDGRKETKTIYVEKGNQPKLYPQRDKIVFANFQRVLYKVEVGEFTPVAIVNFLSKSMIYPQQIECHPQTTMDDIVITRKIKEPTPKPHHPNQWKFKSSSSNSTYIVTETLGKFKCNCPGFWRAKGNCKHIKEVKEK
jgi:hypothetical protein